MKRVAVASLVLTSRHHNFNCLVLWRTTCEKSFSGRWSTAECRVRASAQVRTNLLGENTRYFSKAYEISWLVFWLFSKLIMPSSTSQNKSEKLSHVEVVNRKKQKINVLCENNCSCTV